MQVNTKSVEKELESKYGLLDDLKGESELDISETIKELSYLTHSYFRYYGKFPSKLANHFLQKYSNKNSILLDNYTGSGTGLVEASLLGIPSYGVDINPLAVLASNVKTRKYDTKLLRKYWAEISELINDAEPSKDLSEYTPDWSSLDKWFTELAIRELATIKYVLLTYKFKKQGDKEFFLLGFSSIIRRVSRAYDGEVRPHVNKGKRERSPVSAFSKKITEMIEIADAFNVASKHDVVSKSYLASNLELSHVEDIKKAKINLVLSHPPYLNCFDYIPVFSLELRWTEGIEIIWGNKSLKDVQKMETKSWPATTEKVLYGYFDGLKKAYSEVFDVLEKGAVCGVVIGDATIRGELIRVHKILGAMLKDIGFEPVEVIYRTTNYGIGKYAYSHRADYHGEAEEKRDGILVFRKP
ncbi:MAG: DNA methyltransferase [Candidatus Saccharimonadales bacterium]